MGNPLYRDVLVMYPNAVPIRAGAYYTYTQLGYIAAPDQLVWFCHKCDVRHGDERMAYAFLSSVKVSHG